MVWNTRLCLARWGQPPPPGCAPSWSLVKINPVLAKPRTPGKLLLSLICPPMALLAQRHRDWGCLLVLPPQTSHVAWEWGGSLPGSFAAVHRECKRLQIAGMQKGIAWKAVAQTHLPAHGTARTETQRLGLLACLATSKFNRRFGGPCWAPPEALV